MLLPEIVVMSHKEDVDGLCSAAIVSAASGANSVILSDYPSLIPKLEKLAGRKIDKLFICDLGLSKRNEQQFVDILAKMAAAGTKVTYIDHHDISKDTVAGLKKARVTLVHTIKECTSVQAYRKFKKKLPEGATFLAAMGALTDYMETKPAAAKIVPRYDRQFLMLEATSLSYMISASQKDEDSLVRMVDVLAGGKYPHDVKGGFELAEKYAKKVANAVETIRGGIVKLDNLAHAPSTVELSSSMVVNFVLGSSEKPAAMVYKLKDDIGSYVVSIRGSKKCKVHLGRIVNEVATNLGGSGGGHDRACGAVVPKAKLDEFIKILDSKVS
jgi:RecJ-like exonuclease